MKARLRWALAGAPVAALVAWHVLPLATGARTLFLRDVLNTHLALRAWLAAALRHGELPLLDPLRAGGQALAGNPNALPFYPDNLLLLVASDLWVLNAHFWLHWLVAFGAAFWLGRAWGLSRAAAWAGGAAYAFSGWFLSQLNLYNGVAEAALAPALAAALLGAGGARPRRAAALGGAVWALLLLAGDPILAALALPPALALALARHGRRLPWRALALGLALGTAVAAPQIVEALRVLPASYRGFEGYDASRESWKTDPRATIDLAVPLFFGRIDSSRFWGRELFGGFPPLHASLHPGWIVLALAAAGLAARPGRATLIALAAGGLACAYAVPAVGALLAQVPGAGLFRFPTKLFLWTALALTLAAGQGVEGLAAAAGRQRAARALAVAAALCALLGLGLALARGGIWNGFLELFARELEAAQRELERGRWVRACVLSLAGVGLALAAVRRLGRAAAAATLAALVAAAQTVLLAPLLATDESAPYRSTPALVAALPADAVVAHGAQNDLFGAGYLREMSLPDGLVYHLFRQGHADGLNYPLLLAGRRTELNISPEGLDVFTVHALAVGLEQFDDRRRIAVLEATGVDRLLLPRALEDVGPERARLVRAPAAGETMRTYALTRALGEVQVLGDALFAPTATHALRQVSAPGFDARATVVIAGAAPPRAGPPGTARPMRAGVEDFEFVAESPAGGYLVARRAWLPIWRAEIDGRPAAPVIANLTRLAVELPPGRHRVRFYVDRKPLRLALAAAVAALAGLAALAWSGRRAGSALLPSRAEVPPSS